jgi:hypothetical protein
MVGDKMSKCFHLAEYGSTFATREKGAIVGKQLAEAWKKSPNGTLIIDTSGVLAVSFSFADEMFSTILDSSSESVNPPHPVVSGGTGEVFQVLKTVVARRNVPIRQVHSHDCG